MGTRLPEDTEDGDFDNWCWLADYFNHPENAPAYIIVSITGVKKGDLWIPSAPEPPNTQIVFEQYDDTFYVFEFTDFYGYIAWNFNGTAFWLRSKNPFWELVFDETIGLCKLTANSQFTSPIGRYYYDGFWEVLGVQ